MSPIRNRKRLNVVTEYTKAAFQWYTRQIWSSVPQFIPRKQTSPHTSAYRTRRADRWVTFCDP